MGNEWQSLLVTENILFPSTETGHHPTTPVEAEHPPTVRFSLQKENVLLHSSSRSVSCCAWLKEESGAQTTQHWISHRQAPRTTERQCWFSTTEHSTPVMFHLYNSPSIEPEAAVRLDGHHWQTSMSGATLREQHRPQYGTTVQGSWGAALSEVTMAQDQPCTEPSAGTLQRLWSRTSWEKHTLGSQVLLETMWQCHLPAGAAGTLRMHQLLRKTSRDVNGSGEKKSMRRANSNISST